MADVVELYCRGRLAPSASSTLEAVRWPPPHARRHTRVLTGVAGLGGKVRLCREDGIGRGRVRSFRARLATTTPI